MGSNDDDQGDGGDRPDELARIMRRMADGDEAAVVTMIERYQAPLAAAVHRAARQRRARIDRDDVDSLVIDVCFELKKVAGHWSPAGGALPWVWARHRVANVVDRFIGPWAEPLDDARLARLEDRPVEGAEPVADGTMLDALDRVVPDLASARLLAEGLDRAAISMRDRELMLEYQYEKHSGNRAPAATVGSVFGIREVTVRQAAGRARRKLLSLAASDEYFAPLADLPLLA